MPADNDDERFSMIVQTFDIPPPSYSISNIDIMKNSEILCEHKQAMKCIEERVEKKILLLSILTDNKTLFRKAVPDRINWEDHRIMTIWRN